MPSRRHRVRANILQYKQLPNNRGGNPTSSPALELPPRSRTPTPPSPSPLPPASKSSLERHRYRYQMGYR
eukprot:6335725-Pyramimonas_sp.AAC.1